MGEPLCGAGIKIAPTSLPVALSYARSIAPTLSVRSGEKARFADDDQSLGHQRTEQAGASGARNIQTFQRRAVADIIRRFAVSNLPREVTLVQIDGCQNSVGRLQQRQSAHGEECSTT